MEGCVDILGTTPGTFDRGPPLFDETDIGIINNAVSSCVSNASAEAKISDLTA